MRLLLPRIPPLPEPEWDGETRALLGKLGAASEGRVLNIFRTLAQHPKLLKRWLVFGNHVLGGSTLPARERELVILRTGYLCASGYEWAQHVAIARRCGLADEEILRIPQGPSAPEWTDGDRALLAATDELVELRFVHDELWATLSQRWVRRQLMDIVFTVGQYTLVSMALNTFGVQIEEGTERFPAALFESGRFPT